MWSGEMLRRLDQIDVFVPNDIEAMRYTHTDDVYVAARELGRYVELAVVTRGARGAIAYERSTGQLTEVPSVRVAAIDPTGAGDVFVAALMAASAPHPCDLSHFLTDHSPPGDWSTIRSWAAIQPHAH